VNDLLIQFAVTLPALLFSMVFHEVSHGYMAYRLGDKTARENKRLSLNPLRHLDTFGTLVLFLTFFSSDGRMLFGWAKPVPINPRYFKDPQRGMMWVGLAGPLANFVMAFISSQIIIRFIFRGGVSAEAYQTSLLDAVVFRTFQLNVILMVFNLIPVPPLDGSRVVGGLLSKKTYFRWIQLDRYGMLFVMIALLLLMGPLNPVFYGIIQSIYSLFFMNF